MSQQQLLRVRLIVLLICPMLTFSLSTDEPHCPARCKCSTYLKRVSCIGLKLDSIPDDIPTCATELYLSHNLITNIPAGAFKKLANLTLLSLEYNHLTTIENGGFLGLTKLRQLLLRGNSLVTLSVDAFQDLISLQQLFLTDNKLEAIPDVGFARSLTKLVLDNNNLASAAIPAGFYNLTALTTLKLTNNPLLTAISDKDFEALNRTTVTSINLARCSLKSVGKNAFNFPHLQSLSLSYNTKWNLTLLQQVLGFLQNLTKLASLDLSGVISLSRLPGDIFANLSKVPLTHLNLAHTDGVTVIENGTFQYFPKLRDLDLSSSTFVVIRDDTVSAMKKLETLKLKNNKNFVLGSIPLNLPSLTTLDLSVCTSITELAYHIFFYLRNLTVLNLRQCQIRTVVTDAFVGLANLDTLDLSGNGIGGSSLPVSTFDPLRKLRVLNLSRNKLTTVPKESKLFSSLDCLDQLDMSNNDCYMLPPEIFDPLTSLKSLDLSRNRLGGTVIGPSNATGIHFRNLQALESIKLMDNGIEILPTDLFDGLQSLKLVNLSANKLQGWSSGAFNASTNLTNLDFTKNQISVVAEAPVLTLPRNVSLNLTENPFACWCDMMWFHRWITSGNISDSKLPGLYSYKCNSPAEMAGKLFYGDFDPDAIESRCFLLPWVKIIISVVAGVVVFMVISGILLYRYRWPLRLNWYNFKKAIRSRRGQYQVLEAPTTDDGFMFDVFVSYGPNDNDVHWVHDALIPVIDQAEREERERAHANNAEDVVEDGAISLNADAEQQLPAFDTVRTFWEDRDVPPGSPQVFAIAEGMKNSRKVLLIVSREYLKDGRRSYEMEWAVHRSASNGLNLSDIILVLIEPTADVRLPAMLHPLVENDALHWTPNDENGQRLFWQRLQERLRHDVRGPGHVQV